MGAGLAEMLRYNAWANTTLFEACRTLTDAQLDARGAGASGSVRELLAHIAGGQQTFILRTKGRQHEGELNRASTWPGIDALCEIVAATNDELIGIARGLDAASEAGLPYGARRIASRARSSSCTPSSTESNTARRSS